MFKLNCLDGLVAATIGVLALGTGHFDPGLSAGMAIGLTSMFARFRENAQSQGIDDAELIDRMRLAVIQEFDHADDTQELRDARVEADIAMAELLPKIALTRQMLARTSTESSDQPFSLFAAEKVADALGDLNPIFKRPADPDAPISEHRRFALRVVTRALEVAMQEQQFAVLLTLDLTIETNRKLSEVGAGVQTANAGIAEVNADTSEIKAMVAQLLAASAGAATSKNVHEEALLALAHKIAENVTDLPTALRELERTIDQFIEIRDRAEQGSNLGHLIDETMRRIAMLNEQGKFAEGAAEAESAYDTIQARKDELNAAELRAIDAAIDQHKLAFDAPSVARWIERRIVVQTGTISATALFAEIEPLHDLALARGLWFEAEAALILAHRALELAAPGQETGTAQNWLGIVAWDRGQRLGCAAGVALLEEAVTAYRAALRVHTEVELPTYWAMTQNNLGTALQTQGDRLGGAAGVALLEEAVAAYRAALRVYTEEDLPADWAMTQNNLGNVLKTQGARLGGAAGVAKLEEAVTAFRAALRVYTEVNLLADWAMTQNNLAIALRNQGARLGGAAGVAKLEEAVTAYRATLRVYTEMDLPVDWAITQNNLGTALITQGECLGDAAGVSKLEEAVTAYRAALRVCTEADLPAAWAMTQNNLGTALSRQGERLGGAEGVFKLEEAITAHRAALRVRTEADLPAPWAVTRENMAIAYELLADCEPDCAAEHLRDAETALLDALRVYTPADMPYDYGTATDLLNRIRTRLASLKT